MENALLSLSCLQLMSWCLLSFILTSRDEDVIHSEESVWRWVQQCCKILSTDLVMASVWSRPQRKVYSVGQCILDTFIIPGLNMLNKVCFSSTYLCPVLRFAESLKVLLLVPQHKLLWFPSQQSRRGKRKVKIIVYSQISAQLRRETWAGLVF